MKITKFDASRVAVRKDDEYAGLILIRKSSGLDLGWTDHIPGAGVVRLKGLKRRSFGQIRIALTDGTYLDGMAIYMDDDQFEDGIDIIAGRLSSKPELKRYLEKDGEIIFDVPTEPVGEGNPINIVMPFNWSPTFTGERYTTALKERILDRMMENEKECSEIAEAILLGGGTVKNCKNCDHYNGTLSMTDSPCYNCNRRMRDCWEAKKG